MEVASELLDSKWPRAWRGARCRGVLGGWQAPVHRLPSVVRTPPESHSQGLLPPFGRRHSRLLSQLVEEQATLVALSLEVGGCSRLLWERGQLRTP